MSSSICMRTLVCAWLIVTFGAVHAADVMTLESVQAAALESQPLLESQEANTAAQRERAIAAGQLPDPELEFGINELPVNTAEAWSVDSDSDTDFMVGVVQDFPRAAKRRLRRLREESMTQAAEARLQDVERVVRRDAGLAFAEVLLREREYALIVEQVRQAGLQKEAAEIGARTGKAPQSELLAASVEEALLRDRLAETRQMLAHARIGLERWIGPLAHQPTDVSLTDTPPQPPIADILSDLPNHPALRAADQTRAAAEVGVDLARQAYKPDWRLEVGYGYRPEFSEMITVRAMVGLPVFRRQRQDRESAAARSDLTEAGATQANLLRDFQARAALAHHDFTQFAERARLLAAGALPTARSREGSAQAAYRSGQGALSEVLAARQARLEIELRLLELQADTYKRAIEVQYFVNRGTQP